MKLKHWAMAVLFAGVAVPPSAKASVVTYKIDFLVTNFDKSGSVAAPQASVSGDFTVTFEYLHGNGDTPSGITLNRLDIPLDSPLVFEYLFQYEGFLEIGGSEDGAGYINPYGGNDFVLDVDLKAFEPPAVALAAFSYRETSPIGGIFYAKNVLVSVTQVDSTGPQPVPEPPGWALLLVGAVGVGLAPCWRKSEGVGGKAVGWVALATHHLGPL